jgi:tol-pal system protein YbgF
MIAYNDQRLAHVEKYLNLEPVPRNTVDIRPPTAETTPEETLPVVPAAGTSPSRQLSDTELYVAAKQAYDQGKYQEARNGFETMLKMYPDSNRADNAQFWIGDTYYQERWYEKAILEYQKVIEKYPQGNKVAAAMLKQGFAFLKLGDNASARLTLKDLVTKYPSSNEAAVAKQKLSEL